MDGRRRAWGWAAALRGGATTRWLDWPDDDAAQGDPFAPSLPGAQQLALLRRLNEAARTSGRNVPLATADRVLAAGVSGRGRGELPLVGAAEPGRFGLRPVDPDALSDDELLRVAAGLVADDVAASAVAPEPPRSLVERVREVRRPWVRSRNWSGTTRSRGRTSSCSDPTAEQERIQRTPRDRRAQRLAL